MKDKWFWVVATHEDGLEHFKCGDLLHICYPQGPQHPAKCRKYGMPKGDLNSSLTYSRCWFWGSHRDFREIKDSKELKLLKILAKL